MHSLMVLTAFAKTEKRIEIVLVITNIIICFLKLLYGIVLAYYMDFLRLVAGCHYHHSLPRKEVKDETKQGNQEVENSVDIPTTIII